MRLVLDGSPVGLDAFMAAVDAPLTIVITPEQRRRLAAARAVVDAAATGPAPVYGLNTGLGGNLGHRLQPHEIPAFQAQILRGRAVGVGEALPPRLCRAALLARLIGASKGVAGLSLPVIDLMSAMLERDLAPVIPARGSIGASDLALGAHLGLALIGEGEIWVGGARQPAAAALGAAGLRPVEPAPRDGLGLASHAAISVALGAEAVAEAGRCLKRAMAVAVLAGEGYAMNPGVLDARLQALRPAAGQEAAAAWLRTAFAGSPLLAAPRALQDALSFRTMAPVFGAALAALAFARQEVAIELDAGADSPAVLGAGTGAGAEMRSNANFYTASLALAFDSLALALVQVAAASGQRVLKMMVPELSGLPRYLSPLGGASAGLAPLQKPVAALVAEIRLKAAPASLEVLAIADPVEDIAPQTPLAIAKLHEQLEPLRWLTAIEALVAAQAIDLRRPPGLGMVAARLHPAIRAVVPPLDADRAAGQDTRTILELLETAEIEAALPPLPLAAHPPP